MIWQNFLIAWTEEVTSVFGRGGYFYFLIIVLKIGLGWSVRLVQLETSHSPGSLPIK